MGTILTCRHKFPQEWVLDDHIWSYIIQSGFFAFHQVGHVQLDWPLTTALVERWCPETHTFHMPVGEMTITLHDVTILFRLHVHGHLVTGTTDINWHALCEELFKVRLTRNQFLEHPLEFVLLLHISLTYHKRFYMRSHYSVMLEHIFYCQWVVHYVHIRRKPSFDQQFYPC